MMIKLELPDDATVGDLITKLFPNMEFREKYKNLMSNYFEDIKIKRNTWDEKLDWDSMKESGIAEKEQGHWIGTSYDGFADGNPVYDEFECSECGMEFKADDVALFDYCPCCGVRMYEELRPEGGEKENGKRNTLFT